MNVISFFIVLYILREIKHSNSVSIMLKQKKDYYLVKDDYFLIKSVPHQAVVNFRINF